VPGYVPTYLSSKEVGFDANLSLVHPIHLRYHWWRFVRRSGMARRDSAKDWTWLNNDGMRVRLRWPFASVSLSSVPVCRVS
jgi:hypothetical protein